MTDAPTGDLAPACPKSPTGRHCGHQGCLIFNGKARVTCCHCGDSHEIPYVEKKVPVDGHGPFMCDEVDATDYEDLPDGWDLGEGYLS
ncbi:hypothetical protein LCGC14_1976420 [marine sediment metagenome]|uniref:Uncharacterized protein n=1 Tax=marine sediment metagenome TaxID=412755 RepID=A0A0F9I7C5_9ZZZZ